MAKTSLLLTLLFLSLCLTHAQWVKCPSQQKLEVASTSLTIARGSNVDLQNGNDIQCYNYTLEKPFSCSPGVAVAVNHLEASPSQDLFFSIKPVYSDNFGVIPFIVRTQWGYTKWTKITYSFLASASPQLETGYYQIDTGSLSACFSGKKIGAFIPFKNPKNTYQTALTFLNGFEISSVSVNSSYVTPFEVQILKSSCTSQGISLLLSSTSATQVHSLYVSYVLYNPALINLVAGSYEYAEYKPTSSLLHAPPIGVSNNNLAFHGFSGFIISNNKAGFLADGSLINGNLTFTSSSNYYYLCYSYLFLIGGPCGQCEGYYIHYNGECVATCPPSSYYNGVTCVTCTAEQVWDGKQCVAKPKPTPTTSTTTSTTAGSTSTGTTTQITNNNIITCPIGTYWDKQQLRCLPCPAGCTSCVDCYLCNTCADGFTLNSTGLCSEICGDGKRFVLECDDGNKINGDGCSSNCKIEDGFFCKGGSPNSKDICSSAIPKSISFVSSGQSHHWGKIYLNVRANYLPLSLLNSPACKNNCQSVLRVQIVSGDASAVSITAKYIPSTSYSFSVCIDFGREPIGIFSVQIGVNPIYSNYYFRGLDTTQTLNVNVNPALLSTQNSGDLLD